MVKFVIAVATEVAIIFANCKLAIEALFTSLTLTFENPKLLIEALDIFVTFKLLIFILLKEADTLAFVLLVFPPRIVLF